MKKLALEYYLDSNFSVIPLKNDKRPAISSWSAFQTEHADENQINAWWNKNPKANIGIVTGKISGITVVDIDNKGDKVTPLESFPETFTVQTPSGGYHLYYRYNVDIKQTVNTFPQFPFVDIRNDGGYVVASGSSLPNGGYKTIKDIPIIDFPVSLFIGDGEAVKKPRKKLISLVGVVEGNGGNNAMTSLIGSLISKTPRSKWDEEVFPVAVEINKTYKPPFSYDELVTIYESVIKCELKKSKGSENEEEAALVSLYKNNTKKGTYAIAMYIIKKYSIITIGEAANRREIYFYRDGMYRRAETEILDPEVQRILKDEVTAMAKSDVQHKITGATFCARDVFSLAPVNFIPLKNGVYDTNTKKLLPHSPEYKFKFQFPVIYNENANCPNVESFLLEILTPEQKIVIEEWIGYYFYRLYAFKKALIIVGQGDTGKTTLLETIINLIGGNNTSAVSLQALTAVRFSSSDLYEKHGNIVDELSSEDVEGTGNFKMATGGGTIKGESKYGNTFAFLTYAKQTFGTNAIPDVGDFEDEAYFKRWIVIRLEKTIKKIIPDFMARLKTEEERSGLFNLAMVGLARLLSQGSFSYNKTPVEVKLEMARDSSSIVRFASDKLVRAPGETMTREELFDKYVEYCTENDLKSESVDKFTRRVQKYVSYISETTVAEFIGNGKSNRVRGWVNVAIVKSYEQKIIDKETDRAMETLVADSAPVDKETKALVNQILL